MEQLKYTPFKVFHYPEKLNSLPYTSAGRLGSIKNQSFTEFWNNNKDKFFNIDPSKHCLHHCVSNRKNEMIHEYCQVVSVHKAFV